MSNLYVDPASGRALTRDADHLTDGAGVSFPIVNDIPRFCEIENYTASFGQQWNLFQRTQIDGEGTPGGTSARRLFAETGWTAADLDGADVLEVGSGAGRFSRVLLQHSRANLYSIDYSNAVEANWHNNAELGKGRLFLAQASIYELPFPDNRFDKIFCFGVLQHTPDFDASIAALIRKARPGGEIVVDFYPIRHALTKLHAKYLLRPLTKRLNRDKLLSLIDRNVDWLMSAHRALTRVRLGALTRFLPIVDLRNFPPGLAPGEQREWAVLDTFDMFSPAFDNPQRIRTVAAMFARHGAQVTLADYVDTGVGHVAVVRAVKPLG